MLLSFLNALGKTENGWWYIFILDQVFCWHLKNNILFDIVLKVYSEHWYVILHISAKHREGRYSSAHGNLIIFSIIES